MESLGLVPLRNFGIVDKNLVNHKGARKYIGGLVKDPVYGRPHFNDGYMGCSWHQNGEAMGKGDKKPRKDLQLKFDEVQ